MAYTLKQAASLLRKSQSGIRWLIGTGRLKADKIIDHNGRAAWRISQQAIDQYEKEGKQ